MALLLEFLVQQWLPVAALAAVLALLWLHESRKSGQRLSPQQAINLVNSEAGIFVDLRDSGDYGKGHIVAALNIPAAKLSARLAELENFRDKPVVFVCKMGQHSATAGKQLTALGFSKVYRVAGGMMEWGTLQLPLVK